MSEIGGGDEDNFYVSWGDLVSLLLVFFVYLYSISEIDIVKFLEAKQSMSNAVTTFKEDHALKKIKSERKKLKEMYVKISKYIEDESLEEVFDISLLEDQLEINLGNALLFETGSAILKEKAVSVLANVGTIFKESQSKVIVEGHTDDIPIHTDRYPSNWELSSARAASVVRTLAKIGVPESRFMVIGLNQYAPLVDNETEQNRAKNRRVKMTLKPLTLDSEATHGQ